MDSYQVRVPTYVNVSNKVIKAVNLNIYRNLHHHHLNTQKKNFTDEVKPLLKDKPRANKIWIHYEIFAPRRGKLDTMNIGSIVDKYFSDALVETGKIPDDNYNHIVLSTFSFGGLSSMDGYAIATVNILRQEKNMRVLLDLNDVQDALDIYVKENLNLSGASGVNIIMEDGSDPEFEVLFDDNNDDDDDSDEKEDSSDKPVAKPKRRRGGGRPKGSKNKPKEAPEKEVADVDTAGDDDSEGSSSDSDSGGDPESEESPEEGEKEPSKSKGTASKNLFGDEESPSSDSKDETSPAEETSDRPKKKLSIFDA